MIKKIYNCPCCNTKAFEDIGGFDICELCGWQDDPLQRDDPDDDMGANFLSLNDYKKEWLRRNISVGTREKVAAV